MKSFFKWFIIGFVGLILALYLLGPRITKYYQDKYYRTTYDPQRIDTQTFENLPAVYHVSGVPQISNKKAYCQSTALQMISAKNGINEELGYFNFHMGFSYGVFYRADAKIVTFFNDPLPGFRMASPYLGLKMNYLVTDKEEVFLKAIKFYVSNNKPVVVEIDAAPLWGETTFLPHSELIVGYSEKGFEYYEPGKEDVVRNNAQGLFMDEKTLIKASLSECKNFMLPWKFSLIVFDKADTKQQDLEDIYNINGNFLVGRKYGPMASGAAALRILAADVGKGKKIDITAIEPAVYLRGDNAQFLKRYFSKDAEMVKAAGYLQDAGNNYGKVLEILKSNDKSKLGEASKLLLDIASAEQAAGEIFLKKSGQASK